MDNNLIIIGTGVASNFRSCACVSVIILDTLHIYSIFDDFIVVYHFIQVSWIHIIEADQITEILVEILLYYWFHCFGHNFVNIWSLATKLSVLETSVYVIYIDNNIIIRKDHCETE